MQRGETAGLREALATATCRAMRDAVIYLPADVKQAIERAAASETNAVAVGEYENITKNIVAAEHLGVPLCQDTGVPVVYLTMPPGVPFSRVLFDAIADGIRRATNEVPLRPNVVNPLTRHNSGDNTGVGMPAIHVRPGERFAVTVMPKGAGAENVSRVVMLLPSQVGKIEEVVVGTMLIAEGRPCPPVVLGVGIGGTFDSAPALAKEALLQPIDRMDAFEQKLCDAVNRLGIGPMGLGGNTTALAVKIKTAACHTASLPVAVNVQCWANRHATVEVDW
ncbi:MAG: fumarate hydratase [Methanoregula sp.]|uniref:fumarate hydratase n=1 Tax=Methanoregula sp. TaxID=2052170 RepID=UPI003BB1C2D7